MKKLIGKKTFDFGEGDRAAKGKALINIVSVKTGDVSQAKRDLLEEHARAVRRLPYEQIRILSKNCCQRYPSGCFLEPGAR